MLATMNPLPAGTVVMPSMGNATGEPDPALAVQFDREQWFFYVDLHPNAFYQHPVLYVMVDAVTREIRTHEADAPPLINGFGFYYRNTDDADSSPGKVGVATELSEDFGEEPEGRGTEEAALEVEPRWGQREAALHVPCSGEDPKTYAILVQGSDERAFGASVSRFESMLGSQFHADEITVFGPVHPWSIVEDIRAQLDVYNAEMRPCDTLFLLLQGHGFSGGPTMRLLTVPGSIWKLYAVQMMKTTRTSRSGKSETSWPRVEHATSTSSSTPVTEASGSREKTRSEASETTSLRFPGWRRWWWRPPPHPGPRGSRGTS